MTIDWTLPTLSAFIEKHKNNFEANKKAGLVLPIETTWEQMEDALKRLHRNLSSMSEIQYKAYCREQQRNWMGLMQAKQAEMNKLIPIGKQREEVQGDLHEFREVVKFHQARSKRRR